MRQDPLKICLLEPFFGGSHRRWAEEVRAASRHEIDIIHLSDRHWKWRMHGAAVTLSETIRNSPKDYDLMIATDMMDVAVFRGLLAREGNRTPVVTYFHENQIGYPFSPDDTDLSAGRDLHYGFINYTTALASDRIFFNSDYHRTAFLGALPDFLNRFPDHRNRESIGQIASKSSVLPLGLDLAALDRYRPRGVPMAGRRPLLLWNHRWEYDKCPGAFFDLLFGLLERSLEFDVVLLGERGRPEPDILAEARRRLGDRIIHDGAVEDLGAYAEWLWRADILPVTSNQDFFGGSVVEAVYCGCHPILPRRLAYPEHLDDPGAFYDTPGEALDKLARLIESGCWENPYPGRAAVGRYDWSNCREAYDTAFQPA